MALSPSNRVADTLFSGQGDDDILAIDTYGIRDSITKNKVFTAAKDVAGDAADTLRNQVDTVSEAVALARTKTQNAIEDSVIREKINGLLNGAQSFAKFSNNAQQKIFGGLRGSADRAVGLVKTSINGVTQMADYACTSVTGGIMDLLGDMTGNGALAQIFDFKLESTFFSAILDDAMFCGVDVMDLIKGQASDPQVWKDAFAQSAQKAIEIGRYDNIRRIVDEVGADQVLGQTPNAVPKVLANYTLDPRTTPDEYGDKYTELNDLLTTLDPAWDTVKRGTSSILNLDIFRTASDDVKTILSQDEQYRTAILTAPHYTPQSMTRVTADYYPLSAAMA